MRIYKNKRTGVEIHTHGKISGDDWEEVEVEETEEEAPSKKGK